MNIKWWEIILGGVAFWFGQTSENGTADFLSWCEALNYIFGRFCQFSSPISLSFSITQSLLYFNLFVHLITRTWLIKMYILFDNIWPQLVFILFFIYKYIKIIYFLFLKIYFHRTIRRQLSNIKKLKYFFIFSKNHGTRRM